MPTRAPPRPRNGVSRWVRIFAISAAIVLVSVAFGVVERPARADATGQDGSALTAAQGTTVYGPGTSVTGLPGGDSFTSYGNFLRWDGAWQPDSALNFSTGNWPYRVNETASSFTVSLSGLSFTQGKIPAATYSYQPDRIEEMIRINSTFPTPITAPSIFVPFATTYLTLVNGTSVSLYDYSARNIWTTGAFPAWDSAKSADQWPNAIDSIQNAPGGFSLALNATVAASAVYPLLIDPTWVLGGTSGWGATTFANATTDVGDGSVKIGLFADDFNNNVATGWTTSGTVTFSGGTMTISPGSDAYHAASWSDVNVQFDLNFANYHSNVGDALSLFLGDTSPGSSGISLQVLQSGGTVTMGDSISGWSISFATTINTGTWYTARVSAQGNTYQLYWNGVLKASGTDSRSRTNGGMDFWRGTAPAAVSVDNVRVWNTNAGMITSAKRDAGSTYKPLQTELFGTVDAYNQMHVLIRTSPNNSTWSLWTNLKANAATGIPYPGPNQTQQEYYQLQVLFTTGVNGTPILTQITTTEGTPPSPNPSANTGYEPWYPYVGGMVNLVSGNLYVAATDLSFQGKAFPLGVTRSYNSLLASTAGPFGLGWTFNYGQTLAFGGGGNVTWSGSDGSAFLFVAKGTTGGFDSPRGVPDRLVKNADGTYSLWTTDGGSEKFSSAGLLQTITDKNGNTLTLAYTGTRNPKLSTVTDGAGRALTFGYDSSTRIISVTDPASRQVTYTYYASANELEYATDPMGNRTTYGYTSGQVLNQIRDPIGKQIQVNYNSNGQVASLYLQNVTSGGSVVWQYRKDTIIYNSTTVHSVQDARGFWTTVTLNAFGNLILARGPAIGCSCDSAGNSTSYVWDGEMNRIQTIDGRQDAWSSSYDVRGNVVSSTDPGGNTSAGTWSEANNATAYFVVRTGTTTVRGFTTAYAYDAKANLVSTTDPGGNRTLFGYDASGFLNKTVSARGYTTWIVYNASGYLIKTVDPLNDVTQYGYDIVGRVTSSTDPMNAVTTTAYDKDSRVTKVTYPLGNFTTYAYDARGDILTSTDPDGATTTRTYNVTNGGAWTTKDPGNNVTQNGYDLRGNLNRTIDANLHTTWYEYDAYERLTKVTTPLGHVTRNVYDAAGNRVARTDGNGATTRYVYDKNERLNETKYPGLPVYLTPQTLYYRYDANGNLVSAIGFGYTETRSYDKSDRLMASNFLYGSFSAPLSYTYDRNGNRATIRDASGNTTTYFYDALDRLTGVLDPGGRNTTFTYDRDSRQAGMHQFNGISQAWVYDRMGRLVNVYTNGSSSAVEKVTYTFDGMGLRTGETDLLTFWQGVDYNCPFVSDGCTGNDGPSTIASPQTVTVTLTASGVLQGNPGDVDTVYFSYVKNGVFTQMGSQTKTLNQYGFAPYSGTYSASVTVSNGASLYGAITDSCNQCATVNSISISYAASRPALSIAYDQQHRQYRTVQGSTTTTDTYDKVGNVATETIGSAETYTYDVDNELTQASFSPTIYVQYTYDRNGNRISSFVPGRGTQQTWSYDYENRLIATNYPCTYTYSPTGERVTSNCGTPADYAYDYGSPGGTPNLKTQYTPSGGVQDQYVQGNGVDTPIELGQGASTYAYEVDGLGSVNRLTSSVGATAETYTYDAWGNPTASGSVSNSLQYGAREYDPTTGDVYDRARFYDPSADGGHRFLSQDPMGGGYAYVGNSPMNYVDPTGMVGVAYHHAHYPWGSSGDSPFGMNPAALAMKTGRGAGPGADAGVTGSGGTSGVDGASTWQSGFCIAEDVLYVIGIALTFLGLYFDEAQLLTWAARIAAAGGLVDVYEIISNPTNLLSVAGAVIDFTWALLTQYVIPAINDLWTGLEVGAEAVAILTPPGLMAKIAITAAVAVFGFAGLEAEGCGVPLWSS